MTVGELKQWLDRNLVGDDVEIMAVGDMTGTSKEWDYLGLPIFHKKRDPFPHEFIAFKRTIRTYERCREYRTDEDGQTINETDSQ